MSEQGWRAFLAAEGVEDWVVLHDADAPSAWILADRTAYHVTVSTKDGSSDVTVPTDPTAPRRSTAATSDGDVEIAPGG